MVKFVSALFLIASLAVSAFSSPVERRDVELVKRDLGAAAQAVAALDKQVASITATFTIAQALDLNKAVQKVHELLEITTKDAKNVPSASVEDAKVVLAQAERFEPIVLDLLHNIDAKKSIFASLKLPHPLDLIRQQLHALFASASALGDSLIALAPNAAIKNDAIRVKNAINAAFEAVIAHYM